jgi:hypothetical protein
MARIAGVPEKKANWLNRYAYRLSRKQLGKVPEPLPVMAHQSWISFGAGMFELALTKSKRVDEKLKGLASLKAAALTGCPF